MALETATYISDLVVTNPTSSDAKAQGDDHLRLEKTTLKNTFPNVTGPVTATHTQLSSGQPTNGTSVASTSGTSIDFTGIPSWAKKITVSFVGVSTNGTSLPLVQIGTGSGVEVTGYTSYGGGVLPTTGFAMVGGISSASLMHGCAQITLVDLATNTWAIFGVVGVNATPATVAGSKALAATLDRVRVTMVNGTDTFDAGLINIQYE